MAKKSQKEVYIICDAAEDRWCIANSLKEAEEILKTYITDDVRERKNFLDQLEHWYEDIDVFTVTLDRKVLSPKKKFRVHVKGTVTVDVNVTEVKK